MAHEFKRGDVVALKSGGPQMTVKEVHERRDGGGKGVTATWFQDSGFKEDYFHETMLDIVLPTEG